MDETGKRYGRLTVIGCAEAPSRGVSWLCLCDCGNQAVVHGSHLRSGHTKSCGCLTRFIDEVGNRYGRLVVLQQDGQNRHQCAMWLCQCDCGNQVTVVGTNLRRGGVQSCGCLRLERVKETVALPKGEASFRRLLRTYRANARKKGLEFSLSEEEFRELTIGSCHYCGNRPERAATSGFDTGEYIYNGVDRRDNSKGYISGNVAACCWVCNHSKSDMSYESFVRHLDRLTEWHRGRALRKPSGQAR